MSILYRGIRPVVAFDVNNHEHRKWYSEFVKYQTWGRCPVRFMAEALDQDLVTYINGKMLDYYVKQEFRNGKVKTTKATSKSSGASRSVSKRKSVQAKGSKIQTPVSA